MAIKPKLQSLLASANDVTGEERTNLTDAMQDLVDGYGQGGEDVISSTTNSSVNAISNGISYFAQNANTTSSEYKTYQGEFYSNATTPLSVNLSSALSWRYLAKIKLTGSQSQSSGSRCFWGNKQGIYLAPSCEINSSGAVGCGFNTTNNNGWSKWLSIGGSVLSNDAWYYLVQGWNNGVGYLLIFDESGTIVSSKVNLVGGWHNHSFNPVYGGSFGSSQAKFLASNTEINLNETFIEVDNVCVWGTTNNKTANMKIDFSNPADFTKVDWLESTGTQRIETSVVMDTGKVLRMLGDFYFSDVTTRQAMGSQGHFYIGVISGKYQIGNASTEHSGINVSANTWHNFDVTYDGLHPDTTGNVTAVVDDSTNYSGRLPYVLESKNRVCLFSLNDQGLPCSCRLGRRNYEIYVNSVLQHNFYPVYHTVTGIKGMFDTVNNVFHMNAGTGDFLIPSDTSNEINLAEYLASLT